MPKRTDEKFEELFTGYMSSSKVRRTPRQTCIFMCLLVKLYEQEFVGMVCLSVRRIAKQFKLPPRKTLKAIRGLAANCSYFRITCSKDSRDIIVSLA